MHDSRNPTGERLTALLRTTIRAHSAAADALLESLCSATLAQASELFLVGGLVRDSLFGALDEGCSAGGRALDIDLAFDGDLAALHAEMARATDRGGRFVIHDRFGTATATLADGISVDLARTRAERYQRPGALPSVAPASIETDLGRRDFTVNAAAVALSGSRAGQLIDPYGAAQDLQNQRLRTLHHQSFRDDPTRLIRAARYAARLGLTIESRTLRDARRDRTHLSGLSADRFGDAWRLLLEEANAGSALSVARRLRIPQSRERRWTMPFAITRASEQPERFWAATGLLSRDAEIQNWLPKTVGLHRGERQALVAGVGLRRMRRRVAQLRRASAVAAALTQVPDSALESAAALWSGASGNAIREHLQRRDSVRSPISAGRLLALGVPQGPDLGHWLREIEAAIWDGALDPEDAASVARLEQRIRLSR